MVAEEKDTPDVSSPDPSVLPWYTVHAVEASTCAAVAGALAAPAAPGALSMAAVAMPERTR